MKKTDLLFLHTKHAKIIQFLPSFFQEMMIKLRKKGNLDFPQPWPASEAQFDDLEADDNRVDGNRNSRNLLLHPLGLVLLLKSSIGE